jgi:hypothetical protein
MNREELRQEFKLNILNSDAIEQLFNERNKQYIEFLEDKIIMLIRGTYEQKAQKVSCETCDDTGYYGDQCDKNENTLEKRIESDIKKIRESGNVVYIEIGNISFSQRDLSVETMNAIKSIVLLEQQNKLDNERLINENI